MIEKAEMWKRGQVKCQKWVGIAFYGVDGGGRGWGGLVETFMIMWDIVILPGHGLFFSFKIFFEILRDFDILPKSSGHVTSGENELALPF